MFSLQTPLLLVELLVVLVLLPVVEWLQQLRQQLRLLQPKGELLPTPLLRQLLLRLQLQLRRPSLLRRWLLQMQCPSLLRR